MLFRSKEHTIEHYSHLLWFCFLQLDTEIVLNSSFKLGDEKRGYIQSIYKDLYRILKFSLHGRVSINPNDWSFNEIWMTLLPIRKREIKNFLEKLKGQYPNYLNKKFIDSLDDAGGKKSNKKEVPNPECLLDIWEGDKIEYDNFILELEKCKTKNDEKFITILDGKVKWETFKGSIEYLAGFFRCCIDKGWIKSEYVFVAPKDKLILEKTFNFSWSRTLPLQSIKSKTFDPKFLAPFSILPAKNKNHKSKL